MPAGFTQGGEVRLLVLEALAGDEPGVGAPVETWRAGPPRRREGERRRMVALEVRPEVGRRQPELVGDDAHVPDCDRPDRTQTSVGGPAGAW